MASHGTRPWPVPVIPAGRCTAGTLLFRWGGAPYLTVVAKIACGLVPGATMRRLDAPELVLAEAHHRDNPTRTIRVTSDIVPYLPKVDVLFTGHAYPPAGRPASSMPVRLAVLGEVPCLDKTLLVHLDRSGPAPGPLASIPIVYERAFGGIGFPDNPHGTGFGPGTPLPDIEVPGQPGAVAGFGPLSRTLRPRRSRLQGLSRRDLDAPVPEIPAGFDWAYYQAAPPDQQIADLRGDEWLVLEGLHPGHPSLSSRLPGIRGAARVHGLEQDNPYSYRTIDMHVDILHADGDAEAVLCVLRAVLPIEEERCLPGVRVVAGVATDGEPIVWPEAPPPALLPPSRRSATAAAPGERPVDDHGFSETVALGDAPLPGEALPFGAGAGRPAIAPAPDAPSPVHQTFALDPEESERAGRASHLPFSGPSPQAASGPGDSAPPPRRALGPIPGAPWSSVPVAAQAPSNLFDITSQLTDDEEPTRKIEDSPPHARRRSAPPPAEPASPPLIEAASPPPVEPASPPPVEAASPPPVEPASPARAPTWSWAPSPAEPPPPPPPRPSVPRIAQKKDVNNTLYGGFSGRKK